MIKKVMGLSGDTCYVHTLFDKHRKYLFVNNGLVESCYSSAEAWDYFYNLEKYTFTKKDYRISSYVLNDQFFVVGSDSIGSTDSRHFGPIDEISVSGKVLSIL